MARVPSAAEVEAKKRRAVASLPDLREVLRGSLVARRLRCGKASCRCRSQGEEGHGPYWYLSVTDGGRTRTVLVPAELLGEVRARVANYRRAKEALERVSRANWAALQRAVARRGRR